MKNFFASRPQKNIHVHFNENNHDAPSKAKDSDLPCNANIHTSAVHDRVQQINAQQTSNPLLCYVLKTTTPKNKELFLHCRRCQSVREKCPQKTQYILPLSYLKKQNKVVTFCKTTFAETKKKEKTTITDKLKKEKGTPNTIIETADYFPSKPLNLFERDLNRCTQEEKAILEDIIHQFTIAQERSSTYSHCKRNLLKVRPNMQSADMHDFTESIDQHEVIILRLPALSVCCSCSCHSTTQLHALIEHFSQCIQLIHHSHVTNLMNIPMSTVPVGVGVNFNISSSFNQACYALWEKYKKKCTEKMQIFSQKIVRKMIFDNFEKINDSEKSHNGLVYIYHNNQWKSFGPKHKTNIAYLHYSYYMADLAIKNLELQDLITIPACMQITTNHYKGYPIEVLFILSTQSHDVPTSFMTTHLTQKKYNQLKNFRTFVNLCMPNIQCIPKMSENGTIEMILNIEET